VTKISAQTAYTVAKVTGLAVAPVTLPNGNKVVRVSWDKSPNPGVEYRGELANGQTFSRDNVKLSPDGTKAVYDYYYQNQYPSLVDGEKYKVKVTAYYQGEYYAASAAAEFVYTHTAPASIIALNQSGFPSFAVSPITSYNGTTGTESDYDVSVYWYQDPKAPTGVTYELYEHKGNIGNEPYEWTRVEITIPDPDAVGFIRFSLGGKKPTTYRQGWTYKLVAKVNGEEVDSATATLGGIWGVPSFIYASGSPSFTGIAGKKITVVAPRVYSGYLYAGEEIEFYAARSETFNSNDQKTASDEYLTQFTLLGGRGRTKAELEDSDVAERTFDGTVSSPGNYKVIAVLKNGTTKIRISLNNVDEWNAYNVQN
jgi:hypothetical protein